MPSVALPNGAAPAAVESVSLLSRAESPRSVARVAVAAVLSTLRTLKRQVQPVATRELIARRSRAAVALPAR
jgi:hypothetical protein